MELVKCTSDSVDWFNARFSNYGLEKSVELTKNIADNFTADFDALRNKIGFALIKNLANVDNKHTELNEFTRFVGETSNSHKEKSKVEYDRIIEAIVAFRKPFAVSIIFFKNMREVCFIINFNNFRKPLPCLVK